MSLFLSCEVILLNVSALEFVLRYRMVSPVAIDFYRVRGDMRICGHIVVY